MASPHPTSTEEAPYNSTRQTYSPLIFVNSSNPIKDIKEKTHKTVVSRWAVINSIRYPLRLDPKQTASKAKAKPNKNGFRYGRVLPPVAAPQELLSSASTDPFESLPFKIRPSAWRLLNHWLNAGGAGLEREEYRSKVSVIRKRLCFPLIMDSEAAFSAAVALFEISIDPRSPEARQLTVRSYLHRAIPALREALGEALERSNECSAQHAALAITLLMTVAINSRDFQALEVHFLGLAALISRRPDLVTQNAYVQGLINVWAFSYSKVLLPSELPDFLMFKATTCSVHLEIDPKRAIEFQELLDSGLLSQKIHECISSYFPLERLLERARNNALSPNQAADLLRCVWQQTIWMKVILADCKTSLDKCVRYGMILCFTLELVSNPTKGIRHLSGAIFCQLLRSNLPWIIAPKVIFWLCLLAGPHTLGTMKSTIALITLKVQSQLSINTFEEANHICAGFLWPSKAAASAKQFWFETLLEADCNAKLSQLDLSRAENSWRDSFSLEYDMPEGSRPCAFCSRPKCTYSSDHYPDHLRGMLWAMCVADFRKMCDIEWFDNELSESNEVSQINDVTENG